MVEKIGSTTELSEVVAAGAAPHHGEAWYIVKVFFGRKLAVIGLVIIVMIIFIAIFAPWISPYDPYKLDIANKLQPMSRDHLLGTDALGRDTLSRIFFGARTSLVIGVGAVGSACLIGVTLGMLAAYFGGWVFHIIMRLTDALMATPMILLALLIASLLGGGLKNVLIALAIGGISGQCRMMCAQALAIKQNDYVIAGRSIGASSLRMMLRHVLPNAFPPILVMITVGLGAVILAEAGLSFLGLGISPPGAAWGSMVNDGYKYLLDDPLLAFAPGFAIMLLVFGFNMLGDGLRDAFDPRLRGTL
jgi:peptide/nickel transport system permease protein